MSQQQLKEAKQALVAKDFELVINLCKVILERKNDDYHAIVFQAIAQSELNRDKDALENFHIATKLDSEKILAWQGLCAFYEKSAGKHDQELLKVYEKLVELQKGNVDKFVEYSLKLGELIAKLGHLDKCIEVLKQLTATVVNDKVKLLSIWLTIQNILSLQKDLSPKHYTTFEAAFEKLLSDNRCDTSVEGVWIDYLKYLEMRQRVDVLLVEAQRMVEIFTSNKVPLELLCRFYVAAQYDGLITNQAIHSVIEKLKFLDADSYWCKLAEARLKLVSELLVDAKNILCDAMGSSSVCYNLWLMLCEVNVKLHDAAAAETSIKQGILSLSKVHDEQLKGQLLHFFNLYRAQTCYECGTKDRLSTAVSICIKLLSDDSVANGPKKQEILYLLGCCYYELGDEPKFKEMANLYIADYGLRYYKRAKIFKARLESDLDKALKIFGEDDGGESFIDDANLLFEMGMLQWKLEEHSLAKDCFLKAAKIDAFNSKFFVKLGDYYQQTKNHSYAEQCYKRAFELNSWSEPAAISLCEMYRFNGKQDDRAQLLKRITSDPNGQNLKWAWVKLGTHQLLVRDVSNAAISFQTAVKIDRNDTGCWECLAECYLARGSYESALKVVNKVLEMNPQSLYCLYQSAAIKCSLGLNYESLEAFKALLVSYPGYLPALKGLAHVLFFVIGDCLNHNLFKRAVKYCESAFDILNRACKLSPRLFCLWKLMGDVCLSLQPLSEDLISFRINVDNKALANDNVSGKLATLKIGAKCYKHVLTWQPKNAALWHDLGLAYFFQINLTNEEGEKKMLADEASIALKKSLVLERNNQGFWNALGVVSCCDHVKNFALAQHCFIKSIQAESSNSVAWTNLGVVYLMFDKIELAHRAFSEAQSVDPSYPVSWIGQALVAERVKDSETFDLFRHAASIGNHPEAFLGYAHWVCDKLLNTANPETVSRSQDVTDQWVVSASDSLTFYTGKKTDDDIAFNLFGILMERSGRFHSAMKEFKKALYLAESTEKKKSIDAIRVNYARCLLATGAVKGAISEYSKISKPDLVSQCGLAMAKFKAHQFEHCLQDYESASDWFADDDVAKAQVLNGVSITMYNAGDSANAKRFLLESLKLHNGNSDTVMALATLACVENEHDLMVAALTELDTAFVLDKNYPLAADMTYLTAIAEMKFNGISSRQLRNHWLKAIRLTPSNLQLWYFIVEFSVRLCDNTNFQCSSIVSSFLLKVFSETGCMKKMNSMMAMRNSFVEDHCAALTSAKKAVFQQPGDCDTWRILLFVSIHAKGLNMSSGCLDKLFEIYDRVSG